MASSDEAAQAAREAAVDQLHQVLVEVKDFLEGTVTKKGQKLLGKVELILDTWDDDALFSSSVDLDEDEFEEDEDDGGSFFEDEDDED